MSMEMNEINLKKDFTANAATHFSHEKQRIYL
jgi:hypothetical protein